MNPLIKKQLLNCKVASIPAFSDSDTTIVIPKGSILNVTHYQVGKCYIIELSDSILTPSDGSTLANNWNRGTVPKYKYYKCEITKIVGNMVCILGYGIDTITKQDTADLWEGWVPQTGIKLLQELK